MTMSARTKPKQSTTTPKAEPEPQSPEQPTQDDPLASFLDAVDAARSAYLAFADGRSWGEIPAGDRQRVKAATKWLADMHLR
jgi:hypothetical protein